MNFDYLVTVAPVEGWEILGSEWTVGPDDVLEAGRKKMGEQKDLNNLGGCDGWTTV